MSRARGAGSAAGAGSVAGRSRKAGRVNVVLQGGRFDRCVPLAHTLDEAGVIDVKTVPRRHRHDQASPQAVEGVRTAHVPDDPGDRSAQDLVESVLLEHAGTRGVEPPEHPGKTGVEPPEPGAAERPGRPEPDMAIAVRLRG